MSGAECNGCGACCDPVVLRGAADLVITEHAAGLHGVPRPESDAAFALAHWTRIGDAPDGDGGLWTCDAYDRETRECGAYDDRPQVCSGYPWYGRAPDAGRELYAECSYRADLPPGAVLIPVEPIHVTA